ncbi:MULTISPECIES: glycine zipper family protein [unclassified Acidovorax]|uniref:glycine zipper family protein n=2 Tax=unclassified Acidovorax TaxID=2684926 RepID=UPI002882EB9A|nr:MULTISPECIES: glycine zipper family protein [unclassified Acidovorax]
MPHPRSHPLHQAPRLAIACAAALALWLTGCTTTGPVMPDQPPAGSPSAQDEALSARYPADLQACLAYAGQIDAVQETLDSMVEGALVAAALVWGLGRSSDAVQDWAIGGALLGAGQRGASVVERRRRITVACMAQKGHTLSAQALPAWPPAPAPAPPPPFVPPRATGVDTFNAERLAREQSCSAQPLATLVAKGPGFETYSVPCANGDALAVRCEFGNCRVLR